MLETGTFDAVIRNVAAPNGLKEVLIPTWSDKNWQDDLVWHKAVRQSDGSYRATIKASDHKMMTVSTTSMFTGINLTNETTSQRLQ